MPILPRRLAPAGLVLGLIAVLISLPQAVAWAQGDPAASLWTPGWLGLIFGAGGVLLGAYGTWLMLRRDVAGLRAVVYGTRGDESDGLLRRVSIVETHAGDCNLHTPTREIVGVTVCRQQRQDCAIARTEAMTALRDDVRRVEAKLDRLLEKGQ